MASVPLTQHLTELRARCFWAIALWLMVFMAFAIFARELYALVADPLLQRLSGELIAVDVASPFIAPLKLALWLSFFLAAPIFLYQAWMFISPGLYPKERLFVLPLFAATIFLFYLGLVFVYYVVLPFALAFFHNVGPPDILIMTDINRYLNFVLQLAFAFGLAFEVPVAVYLAVRSGLLPAQTLRRGRHYVIVLCFVLAMFLTPPDVFSQILLAVPMWLLYEIGLFVATWRSASVLRSNQSPRVGPRSDAQSRRTK